MPSILTEKGYRFFFWSLEGNEPSHIHVEKDNNYAKFWLNPVEIANSKGFKSHELTDLFKIVIKNKNLFEELWNEYFNNKI